MSIILKYSAILPTVNVYSRAICSSSALCIKQWRLDRGLTVNRNAEGVLTDGPDFTYLDGRTTPLLRKQQKRIHRQQILAQKMIRYCSELNFAKERYNQMENAKEQERQHIIENRLKPKGSLLSQKK